MGAKQKEEKNEMAAKVEEKLKTVEAMETFKNEFGQLYPDMTKAVKTMEDQQKRIKYLEDQLKLKEEKPKIESKLKQKVTLPKKETVKPASETIKSLRGINISLVKPVNQNEKKRVPTVERKTTNISDILKNRNINIQKLTVPKEVEKEEVQKAKAPKNYDNSENKYEKPQQTNLNETTKKESIEVTLNESESDEEDEDDEGDPFWFCGPPSDVLLKMNKVEQETGVRKETKDANKDSKEAINEGRKRKREEDDEDCGDCFKKWVHECLEDISVC